MTKKILVLTSKEGHLSIAKSIAQILETSYKVYLADFLTAKEYKLYAPFYRYFPSLFKVPYKLAEYETIQKAVKIYIGKKLEKEVKNIIKDFKPDLIISTNHFYNPALVKVLDYQKTPISFVNIITDPWTIHPMLFAPTADLNLTYDAKGLKIGRQNKILAQKLTSLGWFVRKEFYQKYNLSQISKDLGFKKNVFTILVCGGSEGTNMILKVMPAFLTIKKPLQIIIVCGTNKTLYKAINAMKNLLPGLSKTIAKIPIKKINRQSWQLNKLNIKIFKFTKKLPRLMAVSDLVIGKAGPNLIFETIASQKPFFAICHISGQEDGNLKLIKKKGLGLVEESPIKAIKLLKKIIANPSILKRYAKNIQKERFYNLQAEQKLLSLVKQLI